MGGGGGKLAIYIHIFLLGQLTITANQPNDIETHECKKNETKVISCLCDQANGNCLDLWKELVYVVMT